MKRILSLLLALCVMCSVSGAFATVGGKDDPLISRSYVDYSYQNEVFTAPLTELTESMEVLRYKLSKISKSGNIAPKELSAAAGDSLSLTSGASFTVLSGALSVTTATSGLIDVTSGSMVRAGENLSVGHRYICAEAGEASIRATSASAVGAMGSVSKVSAVKVSFSDVSSGDWFYDDVYYAVEKGLVNGKTATTYVPGGNLSIAEAIKLAACMSQLYTSGSISLENSATGKWYDSYVAYALENGIISSAYTNYDAAITRSEFVSIFYNALPVSNYAQLNTVADDAIPDVKLSATHGVEIYTFYRAGILVGSDTVGTFRPDSSIQRSEVAAVLTRMYEQSARKSITL